MHLNLNDLAIKKNNFRCQYQQLIKYKALWANQKRQKYRTIALCYFKIIQANKSYFFSAKALKFTSYKHCQNLNFYIH